MKPAFVLVSVFLTGCAVGPNYRAPLVATPPQWTSPQPTGATAGVEQQTDLWWTSFQDSELDSLVHRAVQANFDLRQAAARVEQTRAALGFARSSGRPQVSAAGTAARDRQGAVGLLQTSTGVAPKPFAYDGNQFGGSLGLSWELDLFGRIRRGVEAASADLSASESDRRNVLVAVLGDVGRYYADLRGAQLRLEIVRNNIAVAADTVDLTTQRARAGLATERDVAQAQAQLESVRAQVPPLDTEVQLAIHRLGVLLGQPPGSLESELSAAKPVPPVPPEVPTGVPSDLLRRRPDIQSAEARLAAATARVGEAKADYFPRFTLLGSAGRQAAQLHDLSLGLGNFFAVGPSVSAPLFTGGKIRSNVALQHARVTESAASYQATILRAFEETENALTAYANEQERRDRLRAAVRADESAEELANVQYRAGLTDFLTVLDAQRELYANRDLLAQSETQVTVALVELYRALGGGWSISG